MKSFNSNSYFRKKTSEKKKIRFLTELQITVLTTELRNEVKLQIRTQIKLFALVSSTRRFGGILPYVGRKFVG